MKILHLSYSIKGGAGIACLRLHQALLNKGIDSKLLHLSPYNSPENEAYALKPNETLLYKIKRKLGLSNKIPDIYNKKFKQLNGNFENISLPFSNYRLHEHQLVKNADIIHLHWVSDFVDYPSFFSHLKKPIVWTLHDMNPFRGIFHYQLDEVRNQKLFEKYDEEIRNLKLSIIYKYKAPIKFVSPSNWLMNEARNSGLKGYDIQTIPNCLSSNFSSEILSQNFKLQHKIPENNTVLLFVAQSTNVYRKGMDLLLNALIALKTKNITLLIIGKSELKQQSVNVKCIGEINDSNKMAYYYTNVDAVIIPSIEDNLPNVMLEALSFGSPVVGFDIGGLKDHVHQNITGILSKELNVNALAEVIMEFINNKYLFNRSTIKDYALKNFGKSSVANAYIDLYKTIN